MPALGSFALGAMLFAGGGLPDPGASAPVGPELAWEASLECPSAEWVRERVGAYLRRSPDFAGEFAFVAHVVPRGGEFELELRARVGDWEEHHRLRSHDCAELAETAAALVAITIDPLVAAEPAEPPRAPIEALAPVPIQRPRTRSVVREEPAAPVTSPAPRADAIEAPAPAPEPARAASEDEARTPPALQLLVIAEGGLAVGVFPELAPTVHGGLGVAARRPGARLGLDFTLAGGATLAGRFRDPEAAPVERGGDLLAWDLRVRPCLVPRWGRVDLRACLALGAGQMRGTGVGVSDPQLGTQPWLWSAAELGLAVALHPRLALTLDAGAGANLLRPEFRLQEPAASYVVPVIAGRARLGLELRMF